MEQNLIKRTCDFCSESQTFHQQLTPAEAVAVQYWTTLARVYMVNNQPYAVVKHACKESCATNLLRTDGLALPKEIQDMLEQQRAAAAAAASKPGPQAVAAGDRAVQEA